MNLIPAAALTDGQAATIDSLMPGNLNDKVGSRLQLVEQRTLHVQRVAVTADASGGQNFIAEVSGELVDCVALCTASNASGSATLRRSTTAMTNAMAAVTVDLLARTTTIINTQKNIVQGETLNAKANGAGDRFVMFLYILRS